MFDKNGHASGLADDVATPTHLVILSKNRPESYVVTQSKGFGYGQGITLQVVQWAGAGVALPRSPAFLVPENRERAWPAEAAAASWSARMRIPSCLPSSASKRQQVEQLSVPKKE
jgi:hypothetical protein